jgi:hypothetical protein
VCCIACSSRSSRSHQYIEWLLYSSKQVTSPVNRYTVGEWTSEWTTDILMIDGFMNGGMPVSLL